jgi:hypothetical protein
MFNRYSNSTTTKQQALDLFEKTRLEFLENCRWIAIRVAKEHNGYVNIDQVREQVTTPKDIDPRVYGAVFNTSEFEKTGYINTTRKTSHGRPIAIFYWKGYPNFSSLRQRTSQTRGETQSALFTI